MANPWAFFMNRSFDVIVLGLGAMGSSAALALSLRGLKVLGIEQFTPCHDLGSSHGSTRAIRLAYYEHPSYVPLLKRAYELWHELEWRSGKTLLEECGCLSIGKPEHEVVRGILESANLHQLPIERLSRQEIQDRIPVLQPEAGAVGLLEKQGGFLWADRCVRAFQNLARQHGAQLHFQEQITGINLGTDCVTVKTSRGEYQANKLALCAGPWIADFLGDLGHPLRLMRQTLHWFFPDTPGAFVRSQLPVFMFARADGFYYGFPMVEPAGVKIARHYGQPEVRNVGEIQRGILPEDEQSIRAFLGETIPALKHAPTPQQKSCIYTLTPDRHFLIGALRKDPRLIIAGGFSGHGFKFASVVGEIIADLATQGHSPFDLSLFTPERFQHDKRPDQV